MQTRVTVVGSANMDLVMGVSLLPVPGETVTDGIFSQAFGGKGANTAVAAARAGATVSMVGAVGTDDYGDRLLAAMTHDGISVEGVQRIPDTPTGTALIMVDEAGENCIAVAPGANGCLGPEHIQECEALIADADVVLMQMEVPAAANAEALRLAAAHQIPVVFNYAPVRARDVALGPGMSVLVVNESEATALSGCPVDSPDDALGAAKVLLDSGPRIVLVTLGARGVAAAFEGGELQTPAYDVEAVDTTGAGDTFCGVFAFVWAAGGSLEQAIDFASVAAAVSVTRAGAQPSIPTRDEIEAFWRGLSD